MGTKTLNETFTEDEFEELESIKGDRNWHDAILEEFGVTEGDEQ